MFRTISGAITSGQRSHPPPLSVLDWSLETAVDAWEAMDKALRVGMPCEPELAASVR